MAKIFSYSTSETLVKGTVYIHIFSCIMRHNHGEGQQSHAGTVSGPIYHPLVQNHSGWSSTHALAPIAWNISEKLRKTPSKGLVEIKLMCGRTVKSSQVVSASVRCSLGGD